MGFVIVLVALLAVPVIQGVVRKLRSGTFLPEDRLFMDERGQWWRGEPKSGVVALERKRAPARTGGVVEKNYFEKGAGFAISAGLITFVGSWIYCITTYGFLFGVGLG